MFGIKWQPFKKPLSPKVDLKSIGISDLMSAALLASSGGLSGIGNVGKYSLGNVLKNVADPKILGSLGVLSGSVGGSGSSGATGSTSGVNGLLGALEPAAIEEILRMVGEQNRRVGARDAAINALEPNTMLASLMRASSEARDAYNMQGERAASRTQNRSLGDAYRLQASNKGTEAGNNMLASAFDPNRTAANRIQQYNLLQPNMELVNLLSGLQNQQFSQGVTQEQLKRSKPPGMLENVLGSVIPAAAGSIDWKKVFKF